MKRPLFLPQQVNSELTRIGRGVRIARKRRRMTQAELADRVGTTVLTIGRIERGAAGTGIGLVLKVLWVLGLFEEVAHLADPALDQEGLRLELSRAPKRIRPSGATNDF